MNPGGGSGWDEPPLDIQVPDDARELDREVLAYHREQRAKRRRNRLRRLVGPFAGRATVMPLLASILAVCLVAGAMLSVATFSPATAPAERTPKSTAAASSRPPARPTATGSTATIRASRSAHPSASPAHPSASPGRPSASPGRPGPSARASGSGSPGAPR